MAVFCRFRFTVLPAMLALSASAGAAQVVEIRVRPAVDVADAQVLLGDIAVIHASDLATISNLVALPLGHAPAAGRETVLRRQTIARWVRTRTGLSVGEIAWTGSDEIVVRGRQAGAAIGAHSAQAAAVHRGDWAVMRSRAGAIEIEDRVEILQDGAPGESVQVRGSSSSASFAARVIGKGQVEANP
jgi:hypothetical protein